MDDTLKNNPCPTFGFHKSFTKILLNHEYRKKRPLP